MIYGAKKGQKQQQKPNIAKDDLVSTSYFKGLYGLAEGEILGLADGGKSIRLDGTPLINANGQPNFKGVSWDFRTGTLDQEHIKGFSAVENERNVGVELRHDRAYVQAISNTDLSAVRVRLNFNALREQKTNGDITGYAIEYAIDVQTDGGAFSQVLSNTVRGKASQGFKKSHRIDLPKASKNWTIRVRRITPNRDSDLIADTVSIDAITEIIDAKLRYPATAMLGLTYDASTFSNIAKLAVRLKGKLIKVPSNYDPVARTYSGLWDGTFKLAYSNNPAWVLYDICTHKRYGLGERLSGMVDKWRLYQIGQYCDELVDDGKGGKEPRFAINVYIQKDDDAYKVIQNIASVFRGLSYWDGTQIVVDSDTPKDPVYTFSAANIVGGEFSYTGTRARDRHTVVKTAWDNPDNGYKTEYELVRDERAIAKYGIRMLDIAVFGCTSQSQAQRAGQWALKSEQLETRTVSFKTGLQGFIPQVGQVINVADNVFAGRAISGRVVSHNAQSITLDRQAGKVGDSISIGTQTAKITAVNGMVITTDKALNINNDAVWAIISDDLHLMQFRILTIAQNDDATFSITALQYEPQKYDAIDSGAVITPKPITALTATPITAPTSVTISQSVRTHQNQSVTTMTINWTQVQGAVAYRVRWRKDDGNWQNIAKISGQSVDIDGVYSGNYIAEVQAIDAFDNESLATSSQITQITGKVGKPPRLARLIATGKLFGMDLTWSFNAGSDDTAYTEIQVSPDGRSNIATLGTFAYPTDKHTINGLQGNLTQFYRARIVDKLGNVSDWTAWTSGTTEAQADKVLELLTGQITASQLHQDLSTPIGKINGIETGLASARFDINKAISDIGTERNRISQAIANIDTLRQSDNAKTLELANLTQTVGGHTSSIRDLAITTGELSQRYTQLKTASDNANSEITSIKQTQNGQATQLNQMSARFAVRPNLCPDVDKWTLGDTFYTDKSSEWGMALRTHANGTRVCLSPKISVRAGGVYVLSYDSLRYCDAGQAYCDLQGYNAQGQQVWDSDQVYRNDRHDFAIDNRNRDVNAIQYTIPQDVTHVQVRFVAQGITGNTAVGVRQVKFEYGALPASMYTQEADVAGLTQSQAQTQANIDEFKRTEALANSALSQRITALDTAYKSADAQANAKIATLEQSITDKDSAMSRRVDTLQASFGDINARTATRVNLLPNGGFENGLLGWSAADFALEEHPSFGRLAVISNITNKTGTFTLVSDKMHCEAGRTYVISCDTASRARTCSVYCDLLFYNAQNQIILDGNQSPIEYNHDYAVVQNRHEVATQAPQGAVYMSARFVVENLTGGLHVGVRQVKVEVGHLPSTPYTADTLGKSLTATIDEFKRTEAQANNALSQRIDSLNSSLGTKANAAALNDLSTKVNQVDGKINAEAQKVSTLQTTVNGQTSSIQQHSQSINGLSAQWTLKAESNGIVSGIGLASSNGVSDFAVRANKFYVASPTGTTKTPLFSVLTTPTTMGGVSVPAGVYLSSAYIQNGSIDIAKINKASITSLSALSANIGRLTTSDSRGTFTYTGSKIELRDPQGRLLMEMGLL